jgi:hypothetical protein
VSPEISFILVAPPKAAKKKAELKSPNTKPKGKTILQERT